MLVIADLRPNAKVHVCVKHEVPYCSFNVMCVLKMHPRKKAVQLLKADDKAVVVGTVFKRTKVYFGVNHTHQVHIRVKKVFDK